MVANTVISEFLSPDSYGFGHSLHDTSAYAMGDNTNYTYYEWYDYTNDRNGTTQLCPDVLNCNNASNDFRDEIGYRNDVQYWNDTRRDFYDWNGEDKWFDYFFIYALYSSFVMQFIIGIASLLNFLVIATLMRKKNRRTSTSVYLTTLAVADLLSSCIVMMWGLTNMELLRDGYSEIDCTVRHFLSLTCISISTWIQVAISVERTLCVAIPLKVKLICTLTRAKICVVAICIICCIPRSILLIINPVVFREFKNPWECDEHDCADNEQYPRCVAAEVSTSVDIDAIESAVVAWFGTFIPYMLILVCTIIISYTLFARTKHAPTYSRRKDTEIVKMLLILNILYLVLVMPDTFLTYFQDSIQDGHTREEQIIIEIIYLISAIMRDANFSVNFFVYFLNGAIFRNELKELLIGLKCKCFSRATFPNHNENSTR